jgi:hypothetical protein
MAVKLKMVKIAVRLDRMLLSKRDAIEQKKSCCADDDGRKLRLKLVGQKKVNRQFVRSGDATSREQGSASRNGRTNRQWGSHWSPVCMTQYAASSRQDRAGFE